jgi:hypothetical protein
MRETDTYESPSRVPAGVALLLVVVGAAAMVVGFATGIPAALDGSGAGAGPWIALFLVGAALVLAGAVVSVVCLIRGLARGLALFALLAAVAVGVAVLSLRLAAVAT